MPRRTHEDAMRTRRRILEASLEIFSRQGFEKTSLTDIAREAGVTRGAIYWHFENKNELLCELCRFILEDRGIVANLLAASKHSETDPLGKLRQWVLGHLDSNAQQFFASSIVAEVNKLIHLNDAAPELLERLGEIGDTRLFLLKEALRNAVFHRQLPADFDVEAGALYLSILVTGYREMIIGLNHFKDKNEELKKSKKAFETMVGTAFATLQFMCARQQDRIRNL